MVLLKNNVNSIFLIGVSLLANNVLGFGVSFFSPGSTLNTGLFVMTVFTDYPTRVNVKFAVQNPDNSLTAVESSTLFNVIPTDFTKINIPADMEAGVNYWLVAIDAANSERYTTYGPFAIYKTFDRSNPTASITMSSGTTYATNGASIPMSTSSVGPKITSSSKPTPTPTNSSNTSSPKASSTADDFKPNPGGESSSLSTGAIIGIVAGGMGGIMIIVMLCLCCCYKRIVKAVNPLSLIAIPAVKKPSHYSNNNSSTIPMTLPTKNKPPSNSAISQSKSAPNNNINATNNSPLQIPASSTPSSNTNTSTADYTFNGNSESTYNYQYHAGYPPPQGYSQYPYLSHQNMVHYSTHHHDSMPVPEHHFGENNNVYPPLSPTLNSNSYNYYPPYQQQYNPSYPPQQQPWDNQLPGQFNDTGANNHSYPPLMTGKVEAGDESVLSQKVEYDGAPADNKAEYHQKPDTTIDEQPVYSKPNEKRL